MVNHNTYIITTNHHTLGFCCPPFFICCICWACCIWSISIGFMPCIRPGTGCCCGGCALWLAPCSSISLTYFVTMPMCCITLIIPISISWKILVSSGFWATIYSLMFFMKSYSSYPYFSNTISLRIRANSIGIAWTFYCVFSRQSKIALISSFLDSSRLVWYITIYLATSYGTSWVGLIDYLHQYTYYLILDLICDCIIIRWLVNPLSIIRTSLSSSWLLVSPNFLAISLWASTMTISLLIKNSFKFSKYLAGSLRLALCFILAYLVILSFSDLNNS